MQLFSLLRKTLSEYKNNASTIIKLVLLFYALPVLITLSIAALLFYSTGLSSDITKIVDLRNALNQSVQENNLQLAEQNEKLLGETAFDMLKKGAIIIIPVGILYIIAFFIMMLGWLSIFAASFKKTRFSLAEALKEAKPFYWKFLSLYFVFAAILLLVLFLSLITVFLLAIIQEPIITAILILTIFLLTIYLVITFILSPYILVKEKKKIFESLGKSWRLAHKNWGKIFGYTFLIVISLIILGMIISGIDYIITISLNLKILHIILIIAQYILNAFIIYPILILFYKNFYLEAKK